MHTELTRPNPGMIIPFGILLASIALGPLMGKHWWEKHYPKVAITLGLITLAYYCFALRAYSNILHTAHEYLSFIILIGALFIVSGGIHISVKGEATPWANTVFLLIGAVLANIFGTTGASMLLIRPWIRMNKYRVTAHHIVFFMFIVSNVGGCLTPIGDPPLFLGYLKGIPFWWVAEHCWQIWACKSKTWERYPRLQSIIPTTRTRSRKKLPKAVPIKGCWYVVRAPEWRLALIK